MYTGYKQHCQNSLWHKIQKKWIDAREFSCTAKIAGYKTENICNIGTIGGTANYLWNTNQTVSMNT